MAEEEWRDNQLLVWRRTRLAMTLSKKMKQAMYKVSVIVPTYNRLKRLTKVLAALEKQTVPLEDYEVIVVSDGSTDGTDDFLNTLQPDLHFTAVCQSNGGAAAARNNGLRHARGELVLFIDDDVVPTPTLLAEHLLSHENSTTDAAVLGPMLTPTNFRMAPWVRWEQAMLMKQYSAMENRDWEPTARQFYTGNCSLSRALIEQVGGFDEHFGRAEDVELAYRLADRGLRFIYNPNAVGYHYADRSFQSWSQTPYQYGCNDVLFSRDKGQPWLLTTFFREFRQRHPLVRMLVRICLGRRLFSRCAIATLRTMASFSNWIGWERASLAAYSGIFNLRHIQGIADGLGGRSKFFRHLHNR